MLLTARCLGWKVPRWNRYRLGIGTGWIVRLARCNAHAHSIGRLITIGHILAFCRSPLQKGEILEMKTPRGRSKPALSVLAVVAAGALISQVLPGPSSHAAGRHAGTTVLAAASHRPGAADGLGQLSGLLPRDHLTEESAIRVDLSNETVRMPLYRGTAYKGTSRQETVWYLLLDASDSGLAHDLGVNFAPKLANIGISCPTCIQTETLDSPSPAQNHFGPATVNFKGAPNFRPTRTAVPGPHGFPLKEFHPGAVAGPGYSPFIRIAGSNVIYNAPIVATGNRPFDVTRHTDTADRVLGIHIARPAAQGQYNDSWADMLFIKGFDAGQPIVYLSTDAGQPLTAVLERATYVPALNGASFNGGDDFLGSARERLFGFVNGQTGPNNPQSQGFEHPGLDSRISEDASAGNHAFINGLRNGGDLLEVFGDFPTLKDRRHADAYCGTRNSACGPTRP